MGRSLLVGKVRLQKWFVTMPSKAKERIVRDVTQLVLARKPKQCNFLEYQGAVIRIIHWFQSNLSSSSKLMLIRSDSRVIYRRYASLYFVCGVTVGENELNTLEIVHRYVESLNDHFGTVSSSPSVLCSSLSPLIVF